MHTKQCTQCGEEKPITCFSHNRTKKDGRQVHCKECAAAHKRALRKANPEKVRADSRRWHKNNPEKARANSRRYREAHRKVIREKARIYSREWRKKNPERAEAGRKTWRKQNPRKRALAEGRRNARKRGIKENFTIEMDRFVHRFWENECALCGAEINLTLDHWYPLSRGYALTMRNAVLLCGPCNSSKHDKMPASFLEKATVARIERKLARQEKQWNRLAAKKASGG